MAGEIRTAPIKVVGRYAMHEEIAAGGMASVHYGRLLGPVGFARTVAIKRLHERLARDPKFTSMFLDEARLAARIRHPNVVPTLDVVAAEGELFLVMEYVQGETLARLLSSACQTKEPIPISMVTTVMVGALHGLHAAHEATNEQGHPLDLVHRDVSPQNILVGIDGVPRLLDFGVAKATGRVQSTRDGELKGKLSYMAPEQLHGASVTRAADIYACGVVLWEALAGKRLFKADTEAEIVMAVLEGKIEPLAKYRPDIVPELDRIARKALSLEVGDRFATAREMARALEKVAALLPASDIGEWVERAAGVSLADRASRIASIERASIPDMDLSEIGTPSGSSAEAGTPTASGQTLPSEPQMRPDDTRLPVAATPRRRVVTVAIVAAIGIALAGAAMIGRSTGASTPNALANANPVTIDPASVPLTVISAAPSAALDPVSSGPAQPPPGAAPTAVAPSASAIVAKPPPARSATRSPCDPPYVIDAAGNRKYKRECLR